MSQKMHGEFAGPQGNHLVQLDENSVTVVFDGTAHRFTKSGSPISLNYRSRAILRALLESALTDLDAS